MNIIETHLKCAICKDLYVYPRLYPCGHSTCESCMASIDTHTATPSAFHLTIYSCPICRNKTMVPWFYREENIALRRIVECHPTYVARMQEHGERIQVEEEDIEENDVDLECLCHRARDHEARKLYSTLFPLLYRAAKRGKQYVLITNINDIRRIEPVADVLANLFIEKHNIYKFMVTRTECTIVFTKDAFQVNREFVRAEDDMIESDFEEELQAVSTLLPLLEIP